ncbi:MAG: hypothetical protein JJT75_10850 [Opitutales bacterium]|nr:hypothetical protein [Opitutales bacterium]
MPNSPDLTDDRLQWEEVVLVPDQPFFWKNVELPDNLPANELDSFLEMMLEQTSPFPVHQVYYGYYRPAKGRKILLFAAYRKRIEELVGASLDDADLVAPALLSVLPGEGLDDKAVLLRFGEGLSLIQMARAGEVPVKIVSRLVPEEEEGAFPESVVEKLYAKAGLKREEGKEKRLFGPVFLGWDNKQAVFRFTPENGDKAPVLRKGGLSHSASATMDIRDKEVLAAKKAEKRRNAWYLRALWVSAAALLLLLLGEGVRFGADSFLEAQQTEVNERQDRVEKIQEQESFAQRMRGIAENQLLPFSMLEVVNRVRPDSIFFTRAELTSDLRLEVVAETANSDDVIRYESALAEAVEISDVDILNQTLREGRTNFRMRLTFAEEPFQRFVRNGSLPAGSSGTLPEPSLTTEPELDLPGGEE